MSGSIYVPTASPEEERRREAEALLYGRERKRPTVWTPGAITDHWVVEWRERVRSDQDAVNLVWGPAGSGKSTLVLDLAPRIDPTFTPETLPSRVAFRSEHVPLIYRNTPRYGVAWVDEAVTSGLLSTETFTPDQRELVELVNIIRSANVVLFVCLPDPAELAKSFRARRADYRIEVIKESPDATPYAQVGRRVRGRKFFLDDGKWLGFSDDPEANPLTWPDYRTSDDPMRRALWGAYYPLKERYRRERVDEIVQSQATRARTRERRKR